MAIVVVTKSSTDIKVGIILSTTKSGLIRVKEIKEGSLFQSTDLKVGMIVKSVNGISLDELTSVEVTNIIKETNGMVSLEVSLPNAPPPNGAPNGGRWGTYTNYSKENKHEQSDSCGDFLCFCAALLMCGFCHCDECSGVENQDF